MEKEVLRSLLMFGALGVGSGVLAGFFGIGGGVIIVPALVLLMGMSQHSAQGTSLAVMVLPVGLLGALRYWRSGDVHVTGALALAVGILLGGYFGAERAVGVSDEALRKSFAVFLFAVAIKMFFSKN